MALSGRIWRVSALPFYGAARPDPESDTLGRP